ncbi:kinase-like domain-containing protein [Aspergillus egyptiacus]|nr:kinase-like domain-containing protein [Aspergillus egyptiacus]
MSSQELHTSTESGDVFQQIGLYLPITIEDAEHPSLYQPGGHHPVHIADCLGDRGQYRVINKLGTGGFGNAWLCRVLDQEPTKYVAVKILMAHLSNDEDSGREKRIGRRLLKIAKEDPLIERYCLLPLDDFTISGPNGVHQCFVYPVAGPSTKKIWITVDDQQKTLRNLAAQTAEAMATLHRHGICHGDFRPCNVLLRLNPLDGMTEEEVIETLHKPRGCGIHVRDGFPEPGPHAPEYVVQPIQWDDVNSGIVSEQICVVDFGEAFEASAAPANGTGIPYPYRAPELALENKCGFASDIWSLALTMFMIRIGEPLFTTWDDELDSFLMGVVDYLGPLPEPWWSTTWGNRKEQYRDDPDAEGKAVRLTPHPFENYAPSLRRDMDHTIFQGSQWGGDPCGYCWTKMAEEEKDVFEDLIRLMCTLDPGKRPSIEQVLQHPWFSLELPKAEPESDSGHEESDYESACETIYETAYESQYESGSESEAEPKIRPAIRPETEPGSNKDTTPDHKAIIETESQSKQPATEANTKESGLQPQVQPESTPATTAGARVSHDLEALVEAELGTYKQPAEPKSD